MHKQILGVPTILYEILSDSAGATCQAMMYKKAATRGPNIAEGETCRQQDSCPTTIGPPASNWITQTVTAYYGSWVLPLTPPRVQLGLAQAQLMLAPVCNAAANPFYPHAVIYRDTTAHVCNKGLILCKTKSSGR
jgi:hypothetical protein